MFHDPEYWQRNDAGLIGDELRFVLHSTGTRRVLVGLGGGKSLDFVVADDGAIVGAPCGCTACNEEVQPGHFACELAPPPLVEAEQAGLISRSYRDGWTWYVA